MKKLWFYKLAAILLILAGFYLDYLGRGGGMFLFFGCITIWYIINKGEKDDE